MGSISAVVRADADSITPPPSPKEQFTEMGHQTFVIAVCDMLEIHLRHLRNETDELLESTRRCLNDTVL